MWYPCCNKSPHHFRLMLAPGVTGSKRPRFNRKHPSPLFNQVRAWRGLVEPLTASRPPHLLASYRSSGPLLCVGGARPHRFLERVSPLPHGSHRGEYVSPSTSSPMEGPRRSPPRGEAAAGDATGRAREKPRRLARLGGDSMQFAKVHGLEGLCRTLRFSQLITSWHILSRPGQEKTPPFGGAYDGR